jgi:RNA polymerase sigma factor (sigma-70 family)
MAMSVPAFCDEPRDIGPNSGPHWGESTTAVPQARARARWAHEVMDALDALDGDERRLILLSYGHGLEHGHIAHRLGLPQSTVSRIIASGMQRLAHLLLQA